MKLGVHPTCASDPCATSGTSQAGLSSLTRLYEVGLFCLQPDRTLSECLQVILDAAIYVSHADKGNIQILDAETGDLNIRAQVGFQTPFLEFFERVHGENFACGVALQRCARFVVGRVAESSVFTGKASKAVMLAEGVRAVQSTPLVSSAGHVMGMISTHYLDRIRASQDDLRIIDLLARQAADYLERRQFEDALRKSRAMLESELSDTKLLQEISSEMITEHNLQQLYEKIVDAAVSIMQSDFASMQTYCPEENDGKLHLLAHRGFGEEGEKYWEWVSRSTGSTCGESLRSGCRIVVSDFEQCEFVKGRPEREVFREAGVRAAQSTPLKSRDGRLLGMISTHWLHVHEPSEHDLRLLDILARQAADLIERGQSESALIETTAKFKSVFNQSGIFAGVMDLQGRLIEVNDLAVDWCGYKREDVLDRPFWETPWWRGSQAMQDRIRFATNEAISGRIFREELTYWLADGTERTVDFAMHPVLGEKGHVRFVSPMGTDITDRKRAEFDLVKLNEHLEDRVRERTADVLKAHEQLQGFTYSVAHDFRQEIRGLSINASMLLADAGSRLQPEEEETLRDLVKNAKKLSRVVDDLLSYARLGRKAPEVQDVDISLLVREIYEGMQQNEIQAPGFNLHVTEGLGAVGDVTLLRIALQNLLDNAAKFSAKVANPYVEFGWFDGAFFVRDNGIGFDMTYAERIFRPFERLHRDTEYSGNGIGLANVKRIIERHGGSIWAEAVEGKGASFFFTLPNEPAAAPVVSLR